MDAIEEAEFLARSDNRVAVLRLLAEERHSRAALAEAVDVSQATLGRILDDFDERSWIRHEGTGYVATATGELVAAAFGDLLDTLTAEQTLRDVIRYLPTHAMEFDLRRLADAEITEPSRTRPNAPLQTTTALIDDAAALRAFSHTFNEETLTQVHGRVIDGDQTFTGVFSRRAYAGLAAQPSAWERTLELIDHQDAELRIREEGVPLAVLLSDDRVNLLLRDEEGLLQAALETTDEAVFDWAEGSFDHYWRTATTVDRERAEELTTEE
ncbi:helix-turn-helix transcriptional regulator [Halobaculum sp. MBLA0143]|uniref:helix-turn-helix transcriptional regulator n=1 Tax=Halobaculum sp. MBLA0143 TaxID=3079933 RepID=UPI003525B8D2